MYCGQLVFSEPHGPRFMNLAQVEVSHATVDMRMSPTWACVPF